MTSRPQVFVANRNQALWAIRRTDRAVQMSLKRDSKRIAAQFVDDARRTASRSRQSAAAAQSLRVRNGLVPKVAVGGSTRIQTSAGTRRAGDLFWGSEWGTGNYRQFPPWRGPSRGIWLYGALRKHGRGYAEQWIDGVEKAVRMNWRT